jgi:hypothetical protein
MKLAVRLLIWGAGGFAVGVLVAAVSGSLTNPAGLTIYGHIGYFIGLFTPTTVIGVLAAFLSRPKKPNSN